MRSEESARPQGVEEDAGGGEERGAIQVGEAAEPGGEVGSAEVTELRAELDTLNDRHLRLAAEFDNYRKRNERERVSLGARLQLDLVRPLLEVLDDLERVVESGAADGSEPLAEGIRLVEKKFRGILEAAGLEPVETEGQPFDPSVMEALMTVPTSDPAADDRVADVFQKGYRFGGTLVRPARVRVLKYEPSSSE